MIETSEEREVHLTVELGERHSGELAAFARAHDCAFLHVLLEAGAHSSQPMLSWRQAGGVPSALGRAAALTEALERAGMKTLRVKVEAKAELTTTARYYEAHFKVELDEGRAAELPLLARELGVHLSRNALSRSAGKERRFLTARHDTFEGAFDAFARVEAGLATRGWHLLGAEREAVVYDSNLGLDAGWST
jgi:hypothetical protein